MKIEYMKRAMKMDDSIFNTTMMGLGTGLQVQHIATFERELRTCNMDDSRDCGQLFADVQFEGFDQIPIREGPSIIGVIIKECEGPIQNCLHRLDESMIISAQEPLTQFIELIQRPPLYRLVLQGGSIRGIVTRSDLLKLPVRLFAFTCVTHLELLMIDVIRLKYPTSQDDHVWFEFLSNERRKAVLKKQQDLKSGNYDLPLLECTEFCDKRDIVKKLPLMSPKRAFEKDFKAIEGLRNKVAHAGNYAHNDEEMQNFIQNVLLTQDRIRELESFINTTQKS